LLKYFSSVFATVKLLSYTWSRKTSKFIELGEVLGNSMQRTDVCDGGRENDTNQELESELNDKTLAHYISRSELKGGEGNFMENLTLALRQGMK
jgi:hypothetical protein